MHLNIWNLRENDIETQGIYEIVHVRAHTSTVPHNLGSLKCEVFKFYARGEENEAMKRRNTRNGEIIRTKKPTIQEKKHQSLGKKKCRDCVQF